VVTHYSVDVESVREPRAALLPIISREVHAGSVTLQQRLAARLLTEATAGYAWDRRGASGPFGSGHLTYDGPWRLGLQLWVEQRRHAVVTDQRVTRAGANVVIKLDRQP
jgi:hypothetical protein